MRSRSHTTTETPGVAEGSPGHGPRREAHGLGGRKGEGVQRDPDGAPGDGQDGRGQHSGWPGGGFEPEEVEEARDAGVTPVSLGHRTLRAETAGLVMAAAAMYQVGELGR